MTQSPERKFLRVYQGESDYDLWMQKEDIPIHRGHSADAFTVELSHWKRLGTDAAFVDLAGAEQTSGCMVLQVAAGRSTTPTKHLYEMYCYVLKGTGAVSVSFPDGPRQTVRFREQDLFTIPLNVTYEIAADSSGPVRLYTVTSAPMMVNLIHNEEFIFNNGFVFRDRFGGEEDFFDRKRVILDMPLILEQNYIPNIREYQGPQYDPALSELGVIPYGNRVQWEPAHGSMAIHLSRQRTGVYHAAHRHHAGAYLLQMRGIGYSLMYYFPDGRDMVRVDWKYGTIFVPGTAQFHHHFNVGDEDGGHLAIKWHNQRQHPQFKRYKLAVDVRNGGDQIGFADEAPWVRELYEQELAKAGKTINMPPREELAKMPPQGEE